MLLLPPLRVGETEDQVMSSDHTWYLQWHIYLHLCPQRLAEEPREASCVNFCGPVCASSCVQVLTCAEALTTSGVISEAPSTLIFEKGSLIGLGLAEQASMVSQRERD